jgi:tape measure domain-containing protein
MPANRDVRVEVLIRAATRAYGDALRRASRETRDFRRDLNGIDTRSAARGINALTKSLAGLAAGYAGLEGLKRALVGIVSTGSDFEHLATQMRGVTGSFSAGELATQWVREFARETPNNLNEVARAFIILKNSGLDPMDGTMQALTDTATRFGNGQDALTRIALQLSQAWGKASLTAEDANVLVENGIPVWNALAEAMGRSTEEIRAMSKAGELGRDEIQLLIDKLGKISTGAATEQMNTFSGSLSNLGDYWRDAVNAIAQGGVLDAATDIIRDLTARIKELLASGDLARWGSEIGDALRSVYSAITSAVRGMSEWSGAIKFLAAAWAAAKIIGWAAQIATLTREFVRAGAAAQLLTRGIAGIPAAIAILVGSVAIGYVADNFLTVAEAAETTTTQVDQAAGSIEQIQKDLEAMGDAGAAAAKQVEEFAKQVEQGAITAEEALAKSKALFQEVYQGTEKQKRAEQDLNSERARLATLEKTRAEEAIKAERDLNRERARLAALEKAREEAARNEAKKTLAEKISISKRELQDRERALKELQDQEQATADKIKQLRSDLADTLASDADRLREIERKGMTEAQRQADIYAEAYQKITEAKREKDHARAQQLTDEAKALAERITNINDAYGLFQAAADIYKASKEEEIRIAEKTARAQSEATAAMEKDVTKTKEAVASLKADLAALADEPKTIQIDADITAAKRKIEELKRQVDELNQALQSGGGYSGGGVVQGYASGGTVRTLRPGMIRGPGTGTSDSILARVSSGEHAFVTRAARARKVFPVLNAMNFGSDRLVDRILSSLPPGITTPPRAMPVSGYAGGGAVTGGSMLQPVNINIPIGTRQETVSLLGERAEIERLRMITREASRGAVR